MRARRFVLILSVALFLAGAPALVAQGHFEFNGHYGRWTLDILGSKAVELIDDATSDELQNRILTDIQETYPGMVATSYGQTTDFNSRGDNFGFGFRYYPAGDRGSFSLGLSVEMCNFKILPASSIAMELLDQGTANTAAFAGTAEASATIKAMAFLLTFRWDIFPTKVVHPYITFGGGISTSKALDDSILSYSYGGQLSGPAIPNLDLSGTEEKTLRELRDEALADEENNYPIPNFLPFIQLNLGLKARLTKSLHVLVDFGVFDGFMVSGGIAFRI